MKKKVKAAVNNPHIWRPFMLACKFWSTFWSLRSHNCDSCLWVMTVQSFVWPIPNDYTFPVKCLRIGATVRDLWVLIIMNLSVCEHEGFLQREVTYHIMSICMASENQVCLLLYTMEWQLWQAVEFVKFYTHQNLVNIILSCTVASHSSQKLTI